MECIRPHVVIILFMICATDAIMTYDCSRGNINYTRVDATTVGACNISSGQVITKSEMIQLVQLSDTYSVTVRACKVEITRTIFHCGMHYHTSIVTGGLASYIYRISREDCIMAHETGRLTIFEKTTKPISIHDLKVDSSHTRTATFAGWTDDNGGCGTGFYSDPFGTWDSVTVVGQLTITLSSYKADVNPGSDRIHLRDHVGCKFSAETCDDQDLGQTYWKYLEDDTCHSMIHTVLYEGPASLTVRLNPMTGNNVHNSPTVVSVQDQTLLFSFTLLKPYLVCNQDAYQTEHPKIVVIKSSHGSFYYKKKPLSLSSLSTLTYMNSKFLLIEDQARTNFEALYHKVIEHTCAIQESALETKLAFAFVDANIFAKMYMGNLGYTGTRLGEVIYISQCLPVEVSLRKTQECFDELPVTYNNRSMFVTPLTRLLVSRGTEVSCNNVYSPSYVIDGVWYTIMQGPRETASPNQLHPVNPPSWRFKSLEGLSKSGIYSQEDLDGIREHLLYGYEREAVMNIMTRGFEGHNPNFQGGSPVNMFDESAIKDLSNRIGEKIWGFFSAFGNVSAGVIGLVMLCRIIKWLVDTVVHGTALYDIYGFSIYLFASIWDSVTVCLIHRAYNRKQEPSQDSQDTELKTVETHTDTDLSLSKDIGGDKTCATAPMYPLLQARYD